MADLPDVTPFEDDFEALTPLDDLDAVEDAADAVGVEQVPDEPPPLGRSWSFDFVQGEFIKAGRSPRVVFGLDALRVWIEKTLRTARGAHPIYPDDYGTDHPTEEIGYSIGVGDLEIRVEEALTYHPRITGLSSFDSFVQDDTLYVSFTVEVDTPEAELELEAIPIWPT